MGDAFDTFYRERTAGRVIAGARTWTRDLPKRGTDSARSADHQGGAVTCHWKLKIMNIDFPFKFDGRGHTASANENDHIRQLLEQLIFTSPGERVNRPTFGSGVLQLIFGLNGPQHAATVQFTMEAAVQQWLGDLIELENLDVTADDSTLTVDISYSIRRTREQQTQTLTRAI
jgi:phage baseplate assembly protein W